MKRSAFRLAAGTLALALPLAAVAACGAEKKKTVSQEFAAAQAFLGDSKAASFTLHLTDAKGVLDTLAADKGDMPPAVAKALVGGSITYVADAAGDATLRSVQAEASNPTDLKAALDKVNVAFVVRDDTAEVLELRLVGGVLYAHIGLAEIGRLAKAGGVEDFDASLDEAVSSMGPQMAQGLADVRAGKWLSLPVTKYLSELQDLAGSVVPGGIPTAAPEGYDAEAFGKKAFEAVKPFVKVTDANDSSSDRVLDVKVQARPAVKALLAVLKGEKSLPFAGLLTDVTSAVVDENLAEGEAKGTIRLKDSHLTQVSVDIESLRLLAPKPGKTSVAGVQLVVDIDDAADEVVAPTQVSSLDLYKLISDAIGAMLGASEMSSSSSSSLMSGSDG